MFSDYSPPASATINKRQNGPRALRLLVAQRRLYSRAKLWQGVRWIGLLILGIGAPIISLLVPDIATAAGALTGVWLFIGRTVLSWLEARTMVRAACVQEELDQYLFDMPETIVRAERPPPENIDLLVGGDDIYSIARTEKLLDWYPIDESVPGRVTVAISQRANAAYTDRLIRTTVTVWASATIAWLAALILWASLTGVTLADFLLGALFPVLPAALEVTEYVVNTWKAARDRSDLASSIASRLSTRSADIEGQDLLVWQERLFDLRRTTPQVPNWLYRLTRRRNERAMKAAARQYGHPY
jgi:hypothetical protein